MTGEQLLAGRELDAVVAEKVLRWRPQPKAPTEAWTRPDGAVVELPRFSTDIAAAWDVVERLGADDVFLTIRVLPTGDYECGAQNESGERLRLGPALTLTAETAPLAICRAALFATLPLPPVTAPQ